MRIILFLAIQLLLLISCTSTTKDQSLRDQLSNLESYTRNGEVVVDSSRILTPEQETAFDALNAIQIQGKNLYSTFPDIYHDCYPPDSSFVISRAELLIAMKKLLAEYYTGIPTEQRNKLASEAVLAQEAYLVEQCYSTSFKLLDGALKNVKTTRSGTWILPRVLGQRDIVLKW